MNSDWLPLCGSVHQMAGIEEHRFQSGPAKGMDAVEVVSGPVRFTLLKDKCLDAAALSYKGVNLSFLAKPGLMAPGPWDMQGAEAVRSIMGGLLFTAGLENIGPPCEVDGERFPMHGSLRGAPAQHTCCREGWQDGRYRLEVSGEMRQARLFGGNLVLRRRWTTVLGQKSIVLEDEVENQGYAPQPVLLLYHCNFGYPLLAPGARVVLPTQSIRPRDETAEKGLSRWAAYGPPAPQKPEEVFLHSLAADKNGTAFAAVVNKTLGLGLRMEYTIKNLPRFYQWKSEASGDYALGLEPANAHIGGRAAMLKAEGALPTLAPGETLKNRLTFRILEGEAELAETEREGESA